MNFERRAGHFLLTELDNDTIVALYGRRVRYCVRLALVTVQLDMRLFRRFEIEDEGIVERSLVRERATYRLPLSFWIHDENFEIAGAC